MNLRKHPVDGLRRHTPRRGLTADDHAAIIITVAFLFSMALIAFSAHLACTL